MQFRAGNRRQTGRKENGRKQASRPVDQPVRPSAKPQSSQCDAVNAALTSWLGVGGGFGGCGMWPNVVQGNITATLTCICVAAAVAAASPAASPASDKDNGKTAADST